MTSTNDVMQSSVIGEKAAAVTQFVMHHLGDTDHLSMPFFNLPLPGFISRHGLMLMLVAVLLVVFVAVVRRRPGEVPTGPANLLEAFVVFIRDRIAVVTLGEEDGRRLTPYLCTLFIFISAVNLIGLVPCFSAATANIGVTGALAMITMAVVIGMAIKRHGGVSFFKNLAPPGIPWPVKIIIYPIEIASFVIRAFSLTIRLFANELSGHMVLMFIVGLIALFGYIALPILLLTVFVFFMEIFVAFLQAYIFTIFSAVFISQTLRPEH